MKQQRSILLILGLLLLAGSVWLAALGIREGSVGLSNRVPRVVATGPAKVSVIRRRFGPEPADPWAPPRLEEISVPKFAGPDPTQTRANAIWGSLGADHRGCIWFGISWQTWAAGSARLYCYDPREGTLSDRGDVLTQLAIAGRLRRGESQTKIHSRIVQAADGYLYFASMDELGEATDGSRLPDWGSHLWRIDPASNEWEHLSAVPEALIAVSGSGGRYVYALGYFGHVVYQYDTQTGRIRHVRVGSVGGHISRNLLSDAREHVYVPRVREGAAPGSAPGGEPFATTLVEVDEQLRELAETPLAHYGATRNDASHGIVGFVSLADDSLVFTTHEGYLYHVLPQVGRAAVVRSLGWFHPQGSAYVASLFTFAGRRYVAGLGRRPRGPFEWVVYDLQEQASRAVPVQFKGISFDAGNDPLLYGSDVQDAQGCFYLAGSVVERPVLLRVHRAESSLAAAPPGEPPAKAPQQPADGRAHRPPRDPPQLILQGTGQDWRSASDEDKREACRMMAEWIHPEKPEADRREWALRYGRQLDELTGLPGGDTGRISDWLPVLHGVLMQGREP